MIRRISRFTSQGLQQGKTFYARESLSRILAKKFKSPVSSDIEKSLKQIDNVSKLEELLDYVLEAKSPEDFRAKLEEVK